MTWAPVFFLSRAVATPFQQCCWRIGIRVVGEWRTWVVDWIGVVVAWRMGVIGQWVWVGRTVGEADDATNTYSEDQGHLPLGGMNDVFLWALGDGEKLVAHVHGLADDAVHLIGTFGHVEEVDFEVAERHLHTNPALLHPARFRHFDHAVVRCADALLDFEALIRSALLRDRADIHRVSRTLNMTVEVTLIADYALPPRANHYTRASLTIFRFVERFHHKLVALPRRRNRTWGGDRGWSAVNLGLMWMEILYCRRWWIWELVGSVEWAIGGGTVKKFKHLNFFIWRKVAMETLDCSIKKSVKFDRK